MINDLTNIIIKYYTCKNIFLPPRVVNKDLHLNSIFQIHVLRQNFSFLLKNFVKTRSKIPSNSAPKFF